MGRAGSDSASVEELLLERLADSGLPARAEDLVTAALRGEAELAAAVWSDSDLGVRGKRAVDARRRCLSACNCSQSSGRDSAMGWSKPLELYRPFLSYSELGGRW